MSDFKQKILDGFHSSCLPMEFKVGGCEYRMDYKAAKALSAMLETKFIGCWREVGEYSSANRNKMTKTNVEFDGERFYTLSASGKVLTWNNSEWGGIWE